MASVRQTNFAGGEIAPMSWGRNDRPFFGRGLRTMRNFFPTKSHGAAVSRPGSLYIGQTRDNKETARLIPFVYSDNQSFVLEMGIYGAARNLYFRFYTEGLQVQGHYLVLTGIVGGIEHGDLIVGTTSGATAVVVSTKTDAGVTKVQFSKTNAIPFTAAEALQIGTAEEFFIATYAIGIYASEAYEVLEIQAGAGGAGFDIMKVKYAQLGAVLVFTHPDWPAIELRQYADVGGQKKFVQSNVAFTTNQPYFGSGVAADYPVMRPNAAATATTPEREWIYLVTLTVQDWASGRIYETQPWRPSEQWDGVAGNVPTAFGVDEFSIYLENPLIITTAVHLDGPQAVYNVQDFSYKVLQVNYYRGRGSIPGGVFGYVGSTTSSEFIDLGKEPDYFDPPPLGTHPFKVTKQDGTIEYEHPFAVAFFQNKLVFGGTARRAGTIFTSETGAFDRWDLHTVVHSAGEALVFELASRKFEQVVHLVPHQKLIIGTTSSCWSMAGGQGPLDFDSVDAKVIDEVGMTDLQPLIVDGRVIFARTKGTGVRGLLFDGNYGTYSGTDLSGQSDHLFIGDSIAPVSGVAVTKEIIDWTYAEDPWGLVWAVRADGALLTLTLGAENAHGWARHDGLPTTLFGIDAPPQYKRVCSVPEGSEDAVYVMVTRYVQNTALVCIERMTSRVRRGSAYDDCCVDSGVLVNQAVPALNITGLDHLEGLQVYVCGVGNAPQGPFAVASGAINLGTLPVANFQTYRALLYVGLLYYADLETLDAVSADSKLKQKAVSRVGFEVDQAAGLLGGTTFIDSELNEVRLATVEDGYATTVPHTQLAWINPTRRFENGGRATLRQSLPLPVTVVGVTRELEVGG